MLGQMGQKGLQQNAIYESRKSATSKLIKMSLTNYMLYIFLSPQICDFAVIV